MSKLYWQVDENNILGYVITFKKSYKSLCKTRTQTNIICLVYINFYSFLKKINFFIYYKNYTIIQDSLLYNIINYTKYKINIML